MRTFAFAVLALSAAGLARAAPEAPKLAFPLACTIGQTCEIQTYVDRDPGPGVLDYRCGRRTNNGHDGTDIRLMDMAQQRRGVDVLAAAPGRVVATRDGVTDISVAVAGKAATEKVACGNRVAINHGDGWITDYCHMAKGSIRVKQGDVVAAGQPLGKVGLSGWTEFPHLHISVRHGNVVVDPFAAEPGQACGVRPGLWTPAAAKAMAYKAGVILNGGLSGAAVTVDMVANGAAPPVTGTSPVIAAYLRAIDLEKGDELELTLTGPGGQLAARREAPLERDKAEAFQMIGKKRPAAGWPAGTYAADLKVWRAGKVALRKTASVKL
jgi:hypothetical protein